MSVIDSFFERISKIAEALLGVAEFWERSATMIDLDTTRAGANLAKPSSPRLF